MTIKPQQEYFETSDLALATTLSLWFPIKDVDKTNPRKAIFKFQASKKANEVVEGYWSNQLKVNPQEFFNQLRQVKARLYS